MSQISIAPLELLKIINYSLTKCFFEASTQDAKKMFRLLKGKQDVKGLNIKNEQGDFVESFLELDISGFEGKINFKAFKEALTSVLMHTSDRIKNENDLNVMHDEESHDLLFNIPGVVSNQDKTNVLLLGADQKQQGKLIIKMHFVDPSQYISS